MPTFDWSVSVSDLLLLGGGLLTFLKVFMQGRDTLRDLARTAAGLVDRVEELERAKEQHHEWLISAGLDRRRYR